ncbi:MAG TPA: hypothetical protein VF195_01780 [Actinomycetota bacterium]
MTTSLKDRFRQVDAIPTPWDERAAAVPTQPPQAASHWAPRALVLGAAAVAVAFVAIVAGPAVEQRPAPRGDASWLVGAQQSCVEQYSVEALANREYAFEGVIGDVAGPADPESPDPAHLTTTVTFEVERWFWGGSDAEIALQTYAATSSVGELEDSVGARLLVSGDDIYIWACGFTQPASEQARSDYGAAAAERSA